MKSKHLELSKELRLQTLVASLEGLSAKQISKKLGISVPAVKYRLTFVYKYYGVKNQVELMSLYVKPPSAIYDYLDKCGHTHPKKTYKSHERFKVPDNDSQLPFNKLLNSEKA